MSAGGGCNAAEITRITYGWDERRECGEALCGERFPHMLKEAVYKIYVMLAILHGSEACCLKGSKMVFCEEQRSMTSAVCGAYYVWSILCVEHSMCGA